jgi:hypothetical protein
MMRVISINTCFARGDDSMTSIRNDLKALVKAKSQCFLIWLKVSLTAPSVTVCSKSYDVSNHYFVEIKNNGYPKQVELGILLKRESMQLLL